MQCPTFTIQSWTACESSDLPNWGKGFTFYRNMSEQKYFYSMYLQIRIKSYVPTLHNILRFYCSLRNLWQFGSAAVCALSYTLRQWLTGQIKTQRNGSVVPGWRRCGSFEKIPQWLLFPKENRKDGACQGHSKAKANCRQRLCVHRELSYHLASSRPLSTYHVPGNVEGTGGTTESGI